MTVTGAPLFTMATLLPATSAVTSLMRRASSRQTSAALDSKPLGPAASSRRFRNEIDSGESIIECRMQNANLNPDSVTCCGFTEQRGMNNAREHLDSVNNTRSRARRQAICVDRPKRNFQRHGLLERSCFADSVSQCVAAWRYDNHLRV